MSHGEDMCGGVDAKRLQRKPADASCMADGRNQEFTAPVQSPAPLRKRAAVAKKPAYVRQTQSSDWSDRPAGVKKLRTCGCEVRSASAMFKSGGQASTGAHLSGRLQSSAAGAMGGAGSGSPWQRQIWGASSGAQQQAFGSVEHACLETLRSAQALPARSGAANSASTIAANAQSAVAVLKNLRRLNMPGRYTVEPQRTPFIVRSGSPFVQARFFRIVS